MAIGPRYHILWLVVLSFLLASCRSPDANDGPTAKRTSQNRIARIFPAGTMIYANRVIACGAPGQPDCSSAKERNLEIWAMDLRPGKKPTPRRLTSNSNHRPDDPTCRDSDDDVFLAVIDRKDFVGVLAMNRLDGDDDIYLLDVEGQRDPLNLTDNGVDDAFVDVSGDGRTVYFANRNDGDADLYAVPSDKSGPVTKVISTTSDERFLAVRSGRVYYSLPGPDGREALFSRPLTGGPSVRISPEGSELMEFGAVTMGGKKVVFSVRINAKTKILAVAPDGSQDAIDLSGPRDSALFRLCSPDGKHVVFTANDRPLAGGGAGDVEIYTVPADGKSKPTLLTAFENNSYFLPRFFTADGKAVLYESPVDGDMDIYSLPLDGGPPTNLTQDNPGPDKLLGLGGNGLFIGRPDNGNEIDDEIFYLEPGKKALKLTNNQVQDRFCAFIPGGSE